MVKLFFVFFGFFGFVVVGDMNVKNKIVSVIKIGFDILVVIIKGKIFMKGKGVFFVVIGLLVLEGDDGVVY